MIAPARSLTAEDRRLLARDAALRAVLSQTVSEAGLSPDAERDIWDAAMQWLDPILHLADSATVARLELEATDRRLTAHRLTCPACMPASPCDFYRLVAARRARLQAVSDRAFRDLLRGRR